MTYGPQHITNQILSDLKEIVNTSTLDLEEIVNKPLVITGATGFVGTWLTLSWVSARRTLKGRGQLLVTSRNPQSLLPLTDVLDSQSPITSLPCDIRSLEIPDEFRNGNLIHAATPASALLNETNPSEMLSIIIEGQERIISEAIRTSNKVLFLSSGAVYGRQPLDVSHLSESWLGAPQINDPNSAYHEGKRVAELLGNIAADKQGLSFIAARLFSFVGPFLPLGTHFAAGNFIRDALTCDQISIQSGGGSIRSYLYATDLCSTLWSLLAVGKTGNAYNVGSDREITIGSLANEVARIVNQSIKVAVLGTDQPTTLTRYVPSIDKLRSESMSHQNVSIDEAIRRTCKWLLESSE